MINGYEQKQMPHNNEAEQSVLGNYFRSIDIDSGSAPS